MTEDGGLAGGGDSSNGADDSSTLLEAEMVGPAEGLSRACRGHGDIKHDLQVSGQSSGWWEKLSLR